MTTTGVPSDAPRVVAFADVAQSYVAAWRVHGPLEALRRAGHIADYVVVDASLRGLPRRGWYDVVWLQRAADERLARRLIDKTGGELLLDLDDHLLCRPAYIEPQDFPSVAVVTEALTAAKVVTVTSQRLGDLLARRAQCDLSAKLIVCPNADAFSESAPVRPAMPQAILLTVGHRLPLQHSAEAVLSAIADFGCQARPPHLLLRQLARERIATRGQAVSGRRARRPPTPRSLPHIVGDAAPAPRRGSA